MSENENLLLTSASTASASVVFTSITAVAAATMAVTSQQRISDLERYKNAEKLARALRAYLATGEQQQLDESSKSRGGRTKDKRICQLNAAYKYCAYLEQTIRTLYEGEHMTVPDDCQLLTTLSRREQDEGNSNTPHHPNMITNHNDSASNIDQSILSNVAAAYLTPNQKTLHDAAVTVVTSSSLAGHNGSGMMTRRRLAQHSLQQTAFHAVDASPILGGNAAEDYSLNSAETTTGDVPSTTQQKQQQQQQQQRRLSRKRAATQETADNINNQSKRSTPLPGNVLSSSNSSSTLATPASVKMIQSCVPNAPPPTRHFYFLRSMNRQMNSSGLNVSSANSSGFSVDSPRSTVTTQQRNRIKQELSSKLALNGLLASSTGGSSSSSSSSSSGSGGASSSLAVSSESSAGGSSTSKHDQLERLVDVKEMATAVAKTAVHDLIDESLLDFRQK